MNSNAPSSASEKEIESLYHRLINCWNETNAEGYASLFLENGGIIGFDGSMANSRQEIQDHLSAIFKDHTPATYVTIVNAIRLLSPTVGWLRATVGMVPRGQKNINPKTNAIQCMIAVKEHKEFKIALFQNTPAAFHGRPELSELLTKELQDRL